MIGIFPFTVLLASIRIFHEFQPLILAAVRFWVENHIRWCSGAVGQKINSGRINNFYLSHLRVCANSNKKGGGGKGFGEISFVLIFVFLKLEIFGANEASEDRIFYGCDFGRKKKFFDVHFLLLVSSTRI